MLVAVGHDEQKVAIYVRKPFKRDLRRGKALGVDVNRQETAGFRRQDHTSEGTWYWGEVAPRIVNHADIDGQKCCCGRVGDRRAVRVRPTPNATTSDLPALARQPEPSSQNRTSTP